MLRLLFRECDGRTLHSEIFTFSTRFSCVLQYNTRHVWDGQEDATEIVWVEKCLLSIVTDSNYVYEDFVNLKQFSATQRCN